MSFNTLKIAILTRTSTINFGTVLQAYALQKFLLNADYDAYIVDDTFPRNLYSNSVSENRMQTKTFKEKIHHKYDNFREKIKYYHKKKTLGKIENFKKKYIKFVYPNNLDTLNSSFNVFISGSDQIWASSAEPLLFPFFMQDFVSNSKLKLSYAVSIGESKFSQSKVDLVERLINDFNAISVRELSSKKTLQYYTSKNINIVCDPVFLIDQKYWSDLAKKKKIRGKYIFCYFLSENDWYYNKVLEFSEKNGFCVYVYQSMLYKSKIKKFNYIKSCSPIEFLSFIKYSQFVFTDSFHATLFSIIFKRGFNVFERFTGAKNNTQNGRLHYILNRLQLNDFYIDGIKETNCSFPDYDDVYEKILLFVQQSKDFLLKNLSLTSDI